MGGLIKVKEIATLNLTAEWPVPANEGPSW
jgi:hypothetical protein